jgi:hypothetical protein
VAAVVLAVAEEGVAVVEAEDRVAVVAAGVINPSPIAFLTDCKIWKWREAICGERS